MTTPKSYFKRGDPLVLDLWLYDASTGLILDAEDISRGIDLTSPDISIACQVNTVQGKKLGSLTYEAYANQVLNKGKFLLQNTEPTDLWPVGDAIFDVKISILGQVKHSMSFIFTIVETYTP
jgi:hypothetical protein